MVVDDDDLLDALQQRRRGHEMRDVRVHHEEHRMQRREIHQVVLVHEDILIALPSLHEFQEFVDALVHIREHDMHGLFQLARHARDAHGSAQAVEVLVMVAHDVDLVRAFHDFTHRMRHHARLDARVLLHGLGPAAEELRLAADIHGHLVATAAQREVEAGLRLLPELRQRLCVRDGHTHGERYGQAVRALDLTHLIEHVKFLLHGLIQSVPVKHGHVEVVGDMPHEAAQMLEPVANLLVHGQQHGGLLSLRLSLHNFVVVIDLDIAEHRAALLVLIFQLRIDRLILHVEHHQRLRVRWQGNGDVAHLVIAAFMREYVLALRAPDGRDDEARPEIMHIDALLRLLSQTFAQTIVAPLQALVLTHDDDGLRQRLDGIHSRSADMLHDVAAVALEAAGAVAASLPGEQGQANPDEEYRPCEDTIIARQQENHDQHDKQLQRQIHPGRHIAWHALTSFPVAIARWRCADMKATAIIEKHIKEPRQGHDLQKQAVEQHERINKRPRKTP